MHVGCRCCGNPIDQYQCQPCVCVSLGMRCHEMSYWDIIDVTEVCVRLKQCCWGDTFMQHHKECFALNRPEQRHAALWHYVVLTAARYFQLSCSRCLHQQRIVVIRSWSGQQLKPHWSWPFSRWACVWLDKKVSDTKSSCLSLVRSLICARLPAPHIAAISKWHDWGYACTNFFTFFLNEWICCKYADHPFHESAGSPSTSALYIYIHNTICAALNCAS